mmetsp:Transcript_4364/g.14029  ORF Transcript_4364/g.14029 Transcript_4364/m.14029 type:complete len:304 (-) Transcript_4364:669-1580(-)
MSGVIPSALRRSRLWSGKRASHSRTLSSRPTRQLSVRALLEVEASRACGSALASSSASTASHSPCIIAPCSGVIPLLTPSGCHPSLSATPTADASCASRYRTAATSPDTAAHRSSVIPVSAVHRASSSSDRQRSVRRSRATASSPDTRLGGAAAGRRARAPPWITSAARASAGGGGSPRMSHGWSAVSHRAACSSPLWCRWSIFASNITAITPRTASLSHGTNPLPKLWPRAQHVKRPSPASSVNASDVNMHSGVYSGPRTWMMGTASFASTAATYSILHQPRERHDLVLHTAACPLGSRSSL